MAPPDVGGDAFSTDVVHLIQRYCDASKEALELEDELSQESPSRAGAAELEPADQEAARQRWHGDEQRLAKALERYHMMLVTEHQRWLTGHKDLLRVFVAARRQELDAVKRSFADSQAQARLTSGIDDRADNLVAQITPEPEHGQGDARPSDIGSQARSSWGGEVSQAITLRLRQDTNKTFL